MIKLKLTRDAARMVAEDLQPLMLSAVTSRFFHAGTLPRHIFWKQQTSLFGNIVLLFAHALRGQSNELQIEMSIAEACCLHILLKLVPVHLHFNYVTDTMQYIIAFLEKELTADMKDVGAEPPPLTLSDFEFEVDCV